MPSEFDIQYALEQTRVLHEPDRRIDTFGSTQFEFQIVSELMDTVSTCRVRQGRIEAHKPLLFRPDHNLAGFDFDGFSPEAQAFGAWLKDNIQQIAILKYGFSFRKTDVTEEVVHESIEEVTGKLLATTRADGNPMRAIIQGVDDTWEISLLKFTVDMIAKSQGINVFDFKRRGLL
ncbi:MAG: hypothetical protein ACOYOF_11020 [Verrucomicrobiaceae bacterium]